MQNLPDDLPMTIVNRKKKGTFRENSLYFFMMDRLLVEPLVGYRVDLSQGLREALYVKFAVEKGLKSILPGFEWVEKHLSVDKLVINELSPLAGHMPIAHATFVSENTESRIVIRVHFDRNGHFSDKDIKAKIYQIDSEKKVSTEGEPLVLSLQQKQLIRDQVVPIQALLNNLLIEKANLYLDLYKTSFLLDVELKKANSIGRVDQSIKAANDLRELVSKITLYNDTEVDGRIAYLNQMIAKLEDEALRSSELKVASSEPEISSELVVSESIVPVSLKKKSLKKKDGKQIILSRITQLMDEVRVRLEHLEESSLSSKLLSLDSLLYELDEAFLFLSLASNSKENERLIAEKRRQLPVNINLFAYYQECVLAGDLESVSLLYDRYSSRYKMDELFESLILAIENASGANDRLIAVADFFYEKSELYRMSFLVKNYIYSYLSDIKIGYGFLFSCYIKNDFSAFKMALSHGMGSDCDQLIMGTLFFNILQGLMIYSNANPDIRYIKHVLDLGAQVVFPNREHFTLPPSSFVKKLVKAGFGSSIMRQRGIRFDSDNDAEFEKLSKIDNALLLASYTSAGRFPSLVVEVSEYIDRVDMLLEAATYLLQLKEFNSRFLPCFSLLDGSQGNIFSSKASCDLYCEILARNAVGNRGSGVSFVFYFAVTTPSDEEHGYLTCAQHLLSKSMHLLKHMELTDQRKIMKGLTEQAQQCKQVGNYKRAANLFMAAQIAYTTMRDPKTMDHQAMIQLFLFRALLYKSQTTYAADVSGIYFTGMQFYRFLPEDEQMKLIDTPVFKFLDKKMIELAEDVEAKQPLCHKLVMRT